MVLCLTQTPVADPSGLRLIDTPSELARLDVYDIESITAAPFLRTTLSPALARLSPPVDAATATIPLGIADAPPNTEIALPGCNVVPAANVWRTDVASDSVHPPMFTISTASPAVLLPGSFASTSLMMTWAGPPAPDVGLTECDAVAVAERLSVTVSV